MVRKNKDIKNNADEEVKKVPVVPVEEDVESDEDESESEEGEGAKVGQAKSTDHETAKVTFHIRNANAKGGSSVRVFSLEEHGDDFVSLARSFEEANTLKKPVNLQDAREVQECLEHNRNIKHGIISRVDE